MIEVEKKFKIDKEQEEFLIKDAVFLGEKIFTDKYFDTNDYSLTSRDLWLRNRDGRYELKVPMNEWNEERISDQYHELETEEEIANHLNLDNGETFEHRLSNSNLLPFCSIITTRRKYTKDGFSIDIDEVDFGYSLCEIEFMVEDESKIKEAEQKIIDFALKHNLNLARIRGKVVEYLKRNNSEHFHLIPGVIAIAEYRN